MADNRQYTALEWVVKEIKETLQESRRVLESYVRDPQDITQLRFCQTLIHQVYGSLRMVGFHGAAMLAEEMESLVQASLGKQVVNKDDALEVLMRSILQLPDYLEQVQHTKKDYPAVVIALLNDIRAVRGASLLSESTLFTPDLSPAKTLQGEPHPLTKDDAQLKAVIAKLRQMYQYAAASVIHRVDTNANLAYLIKASERLKRLLHGTRHYPVWEIAHAVIDGLQKKIIEPSAAVKNLLRELDGELKSLQAQGVAALADFPGDELLKNLLYYIGASESSSPAIDRIREQYKLDQLIPLTKVATHEQDISAVDAATLQAVGNAIREEFVQIKKLLDDCLQGDEDNDERFHSIQQALQRVNDTLAILGVGPLREAVNHCVLTVAGLRQQSHAVSNEQLLGVAHALTDIEVQLDATLSATGGSDDAHHLSGAQAAALEECRNGLERAKDAIVDYIATQWDVDKLTAVPKQLRQVRGNLTMLSLDRAADILSSCIVYIETQLIEKAITPRWQQLDSLADVIASVDYYLEFMSAARENDETILDKANDSLESLGVAKAPVQTIGTPAATVDEASANDEPAVASVPVAEPPPVTEALPEEDEVDPEVVEIFIEEAGEILVRLDEYFPQWTNDFANEEALTETRRSFHTLKGSGRMVKAMAIGELAWSIENMLNRVIDNTIEAAEVHTALITKVCEILPDMVSAFEQRQPNPHAQRCADYMEWGHLLSKGETSPALEQALLGAPAAEPETFEPETELETEVDSEADEIDAQLWDIFKSEAETHLAVTDDYIGRMEELRPFYEPPSDAMQRALHTLKGSAHMAELTPIADLMTPLEKFAKELRSYQVNIDDDIFQLIKDGVAYTRDALTQIAQYQYPVIPKFDQFTARIAELRERSVAPLIRQKEAEKAQQQVDPAMLEVLMAEEMNLLLDADLMLQEWQQRTATEADWQPLHDELATLTKGAEKANLPTMVALSQALGKIYQHLIAGRLTPNEAVYQQLLSGHNHLMDIIDAIAAGQDVPPEQTDLLAQLAELNDAAAAFGSNQPEPDQGQPSVSSHSVSFDEDIMANFGAEEITIPELEESQDGQEAASPEPPTEEQTTNFPSPPSLDGEVEDDDFDEETAEIFMEEAHELLEELDESIHEWENGADERDSNEAMQRALHTLKGGARLSGLAQLGDTAHDFETYLIDSLRSGAADNLFSQVHQYQDQLIRLVADVDRRLNPHAESGQPASDTASQPEAVPDGAATDAASVEQMADTQTARSDGDIPGNVVPFTGKSSGLGLLQNPGATPATGAANTAAARRAQPQEVVKVTADLMEELVNLAGETSISRGRMEEQVSDLSFSLDEMGSTVQRLQEQLRRLDIETEAQILFRQEQLGSTEGFDPLEMDRYSQLQQLSRSLIESASDLMDLKETLAEKTRDAETVLLQQSRINTDLQEGLMRSRMVPFSRVVPRLRRIVRQLATELDKEVNLELGNIEGELDRSMMERMVAPLEHMLRNAIDHGIEDADQRQQFGKPRAGRIVINLERDGGDVLIHVADDGSGIDVARVREKAIERNLMDPNALLSDQEILQFILQAGFSTAETITQISGRGVGMDVVNSEIRQMGGSIVIDSQAGQGTAFTIRVPFTVSVNRALMVSMGDDRYAIPLNTIEGIVRISPFELEHYYANPNEPFEYAGHEYQLRYLGTLLDDGATPRLHGHTLPLPVLLVRSADHSVALQVDVLQGSREIVVKSLGPQFRSVMGVSGATIMGDGHVVVILDANALIRSSNARSLPHIVETAQLERQPAIERTPLVMVVDDSVTVRKVTSRLLEREGYDVITAKDGMDAMTILQDHMPDIMLLDIEMPRMDGFEVAQNVRSSRDLQHLPIIMITSRTGEKHRQRGLESGANLYMGKPYQEDQLLESIQDLIAAAEPPLPT